MAKTFTYEGHDHKMHSLTLDERAPRMTANFQILDGHDVAHIIDGAALICEIDSDNDLERWSLTRAGQIVRQTLKGFYVVPENEALDHLDGMASEDVMESLRNAGLFQDMNSLHSTMNSKTP